MRAVEPSYTHERKEDGVGERQKRGTRCACAASMVWGVCELRGVGQVFAHVGMKAHVAHACRRNLERKKMEKAHVKAHPPYEKDTCRGVRRGKGKRGHTHTQIIIIKNRCPFDIGTHLVFDVNVGAFREAIQHARQVALFSCRYQLGRGLRLFGAQNGSV